MPWFACVAIPALPVALAQRDEPKLRDSPLIIYDARRPQQLVLAASPDATRAGVRPGQPIEQARTACPAALVRPDVPGQTRKVLAALQQAMEAHSSRVLDTSRLADAQLLLSLGPGQLPRVIVLAQKLIPAVQAAIDLTPAVGVATMPFVAQQAAQLAGVGVCLLMTPGQRRRRKASIPI